jgi:ABC-type lipoprotein release transport system permease subunit
MSNLLYGVTATDPITFASVSLLLIGVALAASSVPALKAARIDPLVALRNE